MKNTAKFIFRERFAFMLVCIFMLPLAARAASPGPNVLFIITDQQFADAMSCRMGDRYIRTPAMDALARSGMLFTRAYSSSPLCMPYRNSVFTGRYPHETRVTRNENPPEGFDSKQFVSLGTYFRNAGYDTGYSGKWHLCYKPKDTDAHGFQILTGKNKEDHDANVTEGALQFLSRKHDKPFLLVASFLNPHNICEWARRLAGREQVLNCGEIGTPPPLDQLPPLPANLAPPSQEPDGMALMRKAYQVDSGPFPVGKFSEEDWRKHRWGYYRMIEKVDAEVGKLIKALQTTGLESNTLVVFTSDHGECAGAHGFNQKTVLYDEAARIPLILSLKGKITSGTCPKLVNSGIDLLPTLLDFARIEIPSSLPGRSLQPLALGQSPSDWPQYIVVENDMAQAGILNGITPQLDGRMVRTERFKYCLFSHGSQRESLVDMDKDPGETTNLAGDPKYKQALQQHRELLAQFAKKHNDTMAIQMMADDIRPSPFIDNPSAKKPGTRNAQKTQVQ